MQEIQIIEKDWGEEHVVVNEPTHCGKLLKIDGGRQCSLHHHEEKDETFYVTSGPVIMQVEDSVIRACTGDIFRIPPGTKHRFAAERLDAQLTEFSSHHDDDDVVRHEPSGPITEELIARAES